MLRTIYTKDEIVIEFPRCEEYCNANPTTCSWQQYYYMKEIYESLVGSLKPEPVPCECVLDQDIATIDTLFD